MGTLTVKLKYKQQINICIVSHSDNLLVRYPLLIRTFIQRSAGRVCTSSGGGRSCVHMFIIILALLSHLALGAEFDLISDLHKVEVITVCHILEQWC